MQTLFLAARDRCVQLTGITLLTASLPLLLLAPGCNDASIGWFLSFLACFSGGLFLLSGLVGIDPLAARMRRQAQDCPARALRRLPPFPPRLYRYPSSPLRRWVACVLLGLLALVFLVPTVVIGYIVIQAPTTAGVVLLLFFGAAAALVGGVLPWCIHRAARIFIQADQHGLSGQMMWGKVALHWDDVVALVFKDVRMKGVYGPVIGRVYQVYSTDGKLTFQQSLTEVADLTGIIAWATGLTWVKG
jgi:hypothetical protein